MTPLQVTRVAGFGKKPPQSFSQSPVILGTGAGCNVRFDAAWDKGVAAQHVKLDWINNYWSMSDMGSPSGTWVDGRKLTQAYPVTGPVEFELGKGGPRCRVEPLAAPAGQPAAAPVYVSAPTQPPVPTYQPRQPSSGPSAPVVAIIGGVVLLLAAVAGWYFLDYRPAELAKEKADAEMAAAKRAALPPGISDNPVNPPPAPNPGPNPAPTPTPTPAPSPGPETTPANPFIPTDLPEVASGGGSTGAMRFKTGLAAMTPEVQEFSRTHFLPAGGVRLNAVGIARMQSSSYAVEQPAVAVGDEVVDRKSSGGTYANEGDDIDDITPSKLPASVDNSKKPTFPPVGDQERLNSCASFSSVYYAASNNLAVARGTERVLLSPIWTYSMLNNGEDKGGQIEDVYMMLQAHGAPPLSMVPYPPEAATDDHDPRIYLRWYTTADVWRAALQNRVGKVGTLDHLDTDAGMQRLKAYLANGYLANYGTSFDAEDKDHKILPHVGWTSNWGVAKASPELNADANAAAGEPVLCWVGEGGGGHAMTIVGYNDDIWVDYNNDGKVQPEEKGALKVVNSYGVHQWPRTTDLGFCWISYDAFKKHSHFPWVEDPNNPKRTYPFHGNQAYYMLPAKDIPTKMLAQFTLSSARREDIDVRLGISALDATTPLVVWQPGALTVPKSMSNENNRATAQFGMGGAYAFDGGTDAVDGTFVFDLHDLLAMITLPKDAQGFRVYLIVHDLQAGAPTIVKDFRVTDQDGKPFGVFKDVPQSIDANTLTIPLDLH